ncbi:putative acetyltransferase [Tranquillimonas rosea]|uniref:Putative acetyltransferase n=1 Tax=Tranquillimonas rosea TaxID=641238 RepID=A0A1H9W6I6_9RHOB|nr:GNAT family N-acetyltransferase [Tranquillimonas rosea]SES29083.1 putative acetyltransferase [Tranquillimonas rosea]
MTATLVAPAIHVCDPLSPEGRALIDASQAALNEIDPPEENFSVSAEELAVPGVTFLAARVDGRPAGCVALVARGGYGEIKRFYVDPALRGRGVGRALMDAAEDRARRQGLPCLRLETSVRMDAARAVYERRGYAECPAFGGYPDIPSNLFLEKRL